MIERIKWLGGTSFRINGEPHQDGPIIYIDPVNVSDPIPADLILVSTDHRAHFSLSDITELSTEHTDILAVSRAASEITVGQVQVVRPWQGAFRVGDVAVRAVPAYTQNSSYILHARDSLGFLISYLRHDVYYAGSTGLIPEMEKFGCDVALLPIGGEHTMNLEEALEAVRRVKPRFAVPMGYGNSGYAPKSLGKRFCEMVNGDYCRGVELTALNGASSRSI